MPIAATSAALTPCRSSTARATSRCERQMSCGLCSTQPGRGKICWNSCCSMTSGLPDSSNRMARELVVPWSSAKMYFVMIVSRLSQKDPLPGLRPIIGSRAASQQ